ncbi:MULTISPECIES: SapB/AmfS family lanthipeptide [Sorangium]|nr:SapB/AmfS family lanthipeptide [Sorangium cellulosum]
MKKILSLQKLSTKGTTTGGGGGGGGGSHASLLLCGDSSLSLTSCK